MMPEPILHSSDLDQATREHLRRLKDGCVLLARENLLDPNFVHTIVLICIYNKEGAYGLVLNRVTHMPLSEVFDIDHPLKHVRRKLYLGGPVQQDSLQILQVTRNPVSHAYQVAPGVHLGGEWASVEQILSADADNTRLFLGYSGWGPHQLETEIAQGTWDVFSVDLIKLLQLGDEAFIGKDVPSLRNLLSSLES